jgi:2-methylisocitrate lyase-like PEP mutase family enzyme
VPTADGWTEEQHQRGVAFRALHLAGDIFVMPNPWDAGSARLLASLGFAALATTSAGLAHALGRPDGANAVGREETMQNVAAVAGATHLPVSADLESCFADDPAGVAETILLAARAGAVGGSVDDATGDAASPIRPLAEAVERVEAAVGAARSLPFPFTLTARAENFLYGRDDLEDTVERLRAYAAAGADVLYAPGLPDLAAVREVCAAVDRPVNVLATAAHSVAELASCGVARVSVGSGLSRAALGGAMRAAREMVERGTFTFAADALPYGEANALMSSGDLHD